MSDAIEILRSYVRLVARLSGAASVSLYVPPGTGQEQAILIHDGPLDPLPELAHAEVAAELHRGLGPEQAGSDDSKGLASRSGEGILYRIPLRWVMGRAGEDAS